jgi:hypothetical protein
MKQQGEPEPEPILFSLGDGTLDIMNSKAVVKVNDSKWSKVQNSEEKFVNIV